MGGEDPPFSITGGHSQLWLGQKLASFARMPNYRPNVAVLLLNGEEELLICERVKVEGAWQFPQGGVDEGESPQEALRREVWEEIGLPARSYEILESRDGYRYLYPPGVKEKKKGNYDGQTQTYFLCRLKNGAPPIDIDQEPREFQRYRWIKPKDFDLKWLPPFKVEVHRGVMKDFFGVEI